ncbi:MAG: O-antigen ligase family protein [Cyanobacteriota bacterium]|nr:O-antigen ligase family protein [Cyanobacteriota bacterium]
MKRLYSLLYALSIVLINPWGDSRGAIWTQPKVLVLLLIVFLNFIVLLEAQLSRDRENQPIPKPWYLCLLLWGLFSGIGLISTLRSPAPMLSLLGQEEMGDGWLYWLLIASFSLTNSLLLRLHPEFLFPQVRGFIAGGSILALSMFPQVWDWRIDYTVKMGQLLQDDMLASTIFQNQQPIGLYSHRGHAALVLAATGTLILITWRRGWVSLKEMGAMLFPVIVALMLAQTRAGIAAMLGGVAWVLGRKYSRLLIPATLVGVVLVGSWTGVRSISKVSAIARATSGRVEMGEIALRGIQQRPILGWGFNGFGLAYPYVRYRNWTPDILKIDSHGFVHRRPTGERVKKEIATFKAHNLILDTMLSVGIAGFVSYAAIWGVSMGLIWRSPLSDSRAIALVYLIFASIWFECAQFTHLGWWGLSLWGWGGLGDRAPVLFNSL